MPYEVKRSYFICFLWFTHHFNGHLNWKEEKKDRDFLQLTVVFVDEINPPCIKCRKHVVRTHIHTRTLCIIVLSICVHYWIFIWTGVPCYFHIHPAFYLFHIKPDVPGPWTPTLLPSTHVINDSSAYIECRWMCSTVEEPIWTWRKSSINSSIWELS